jgi:pimeloyl-ACP methyl ester carboxylesterase
LLRGCATDEAWRRAANQLFNSLLAVMHPLARVLLVVTAAKLGVALLVLGWVSSRHGWPLALAAAVAVMLAVPAVATLLSYGIALRHRTPAEPACRAGALALAAGVLAEILAAALMFNVLIPLQGMARKRDRPASGGQTGPPVLLVHGYMLTSASWWVLGRWLRRRGHPVYTVDLDLFCDIDAYVPVLHERIEAVCAATGSARVLVVAHSMGGLAVRAYLRRHGAARIARLVTLGSPHHGSVLARLAPGRNGAAMRPGSEWLARLAQDEGGHWPVPVVSVYSCHDNLVAPQASSWLEGATNIPVGGIGHLTLHFSRRVRDVLGDLLDARG